ncbi:monocarboxylate transporter 1-like [Schistocerca serialis cubense]|uniref:monocarboxylate transporter 1-like n=1 Tax=Schistocerca serialis cubense TaxID=2023355 RepID=UPI00214E0B50|nr:monocarboxylate transporter 1-like [Schistocerca serialis cubense]
MGTNNCQQEACVQRGWSEDKITAGNGADMAEGAAEYELVPPDGGWGWMVVLGCALSNITSQCLNTIFSLLFGDKLQSMGLETTSAAVIMNSMFSVTQFSGLLTGPLLKKFSIRQVSVGGGLLTVAGMILTSFANSFTYIIITYSLLVGLGSGLVAPAGFLAVKAYFVKYRGRAVSLSMAGGNVVLMVMPHVVRLLLDNYGFLGAMLVFSGVSMHGPLGSLLFHPLEWHAKRRPIASELRPLQGEVQEGADKSGTEAGSPQERRTRRRTSSASLATSEFGDVSDAVPDDRARRRPVTSEEDGNANQEVAETSPGQRSLWRRAVAFMDLDLLRSGAYLNVMLGTAAMVTATINYALLLPFYLQRVVGLTRSDTALVITMRAVGDCVARFGVNYFTDRFHVRPRITFLVGSVFSAVTRSGLAMSSSLVMLCVWSALCGFCRGSAVVNTNLCVAEVCPEEKLPAAVGLNMVFCGIMLFAFGPIIGYIRDETGDYPLCIHILTGLLFFCMLLWLIEDVVHWYRQKR